MGYAVKEGHHEVDPRPKDGPQATEAFDDMLFRLRHDPDAQKDADDDEYGNRQIHCVPAQKILTRHEETSGSIAAFPPKHNVAACDTQRKVWLRDPAFPPAGIGCSLHPTQPMSPGYP